MNSIEQDKAIAQLRRDVLRLAKLLLEAQDRLNAVADRVQALQPTKKESTS